jgi:hypothetical protein
MKPMSHTFTVVDLWVNASHGSVNRDVFCMKGFKFVVDTLNFWSFAYGDILFKIWITRCVMCITMTSINNNVRSSAVLLL